MKKIILSTLFLPAFAFANSSTFLTVGVGELNLPVIYSNGNIEMVDVDGYSFSLSNIIDDKTMIGLSHLEANGDFDGSVTGVSAAYAFDSFAAGSMYVGISYSDSDISDQTDTSYSIGFAKVSGNGTDYNLSASTVDGIVSYGVSVIADSGVSFGISESNGSSIVQVGYRFAFN